jgi:hypothetical protein
MIKMPRSPYIPGEIELYEEDSKTRESSMHEIRQKDYKPLILEKKEEISGKVATTVIKKMIKDMQTVEDEPLEILGSEVVGNLFDRVKFLKERLFEVETAIRDRALMNKTFNDEMDKDIAEMEAVLANISEKEELREFKLNVTLLRMEKRKENTVFWRDLVALRKSMQEVKEEYENEMKISKLFGDLVDRSE